MLLKGVNKRVIVIKNPGSEIFEEAYFIVKSGSVKGVIKQSKENEMVIEANRIISDYHEQQRSIIETNGITGSVSGDMSELDNFLNVKKENESIDNINDFNNIEKSNKKTKKINNIEKFEKTDKTKKENNKNTEINQSISDLTDEEIFEDEKIFENIQNNANKYEDFYRNPNFIGCREEEKSYRSAFDFISSKKIRNKNIPMPPKSFFIGVGFMSAVIILIRLIEYVILR